MQKLFLYAVNIVYIIALHSKHVMAIPRYIYTKEAKLFRYTYKQRKKFYYSLRLLFEFVWFRLQIICTKLTSASRLYKSLATFQFNLMCLCICIKFEFVYNWIEIKHLYIKYRSLSFACININYILYVV